MEFYRFCEARHTDTVPAGANASAPTEGSAMWQPRGLLRTVAALGLAGAATVVTLAGTVEPVRAAGSTEVTSFGTNPGALKMFRYVPAGLPTGAPLVVAMHGCTQSATGYDDEPGWVALADRWKFALVLPEQQSANNSSRCFNWFEPGDISRGSGEALSIKQMIDKTKTDLATDAARTYVTGLSAGAAMTSVMLATYPDVFAGGAIVAGIPYRCATSSSNAFTCLNPGVDKTPAAWGDLVRAAASYTGTRPPVQIWHGTSDNTVKPLNMTELVDQWTNVAGTDQNADVQDTVAGYPHKIYRDASGRTAVESYAITGMGHGTPIDPGTGATQCGTPGAYILDVNICSSYYIAKAWGLDNTDRVAPAVSITSPAAGAAVTGPVTVTADATDTVGVTKVEFLVDGRLLATDTTAPYSAAWDTAAAANGAHTLLAKAYDSAGNIGSSAEVGVTVTGGVEDTTAPTVNLTSPTTGATVGGTVTLTATAADDVGVTKVEFFLDGGSLGTGTPSMTAGPWQLQWNTASATDGAHALSVRAYDAKGNSTLDNDTTVTVTRSVVSLEESFSDRDGTGDLFDSPGWSAGGFDASSDSASPQSGVTAGSAHGLASSGVNCATGPKTKTLSRTVTLGSSPVLSYARKLSLRAAVNTSTTASFRVLVNGTSVDSRSVTYGTYSETAWTARKGIDLKAWAGQSVTLGVEVSANSNVCIEVAAEAWVDDLRIENPTAPADVTPPVVNVTAPVTGATVTGAVDITATASDSTAVSKVEFYVDGTLLAVDTTAPYSVTWTTTAVPDGAHRLLAKAYDAATNVGSDDDTSVTVSNGTGGSTSATFASRSADDGYVKANADGTSPTIGQYESSYGVAIGRGSDGQNNRTLLSFDTSSVPDGATVTGAYLTLSYNSGSGDPWASPTGNRLLLDVQTGCFGGCTTEATDWGATASVAGAAEVVKFTTGSQSSSGLSAAGLSAVNRTGLTQLRLRFASQPTATAYLFVKSGAGATLHLTWQ